MKNLQDETAHALAQLIHFLELILNEDYKRDIKLLHGNSIGKHIRHIIEFYDTLLECHTQVLNYDLRKRSFILENNKAKAIEQLQKISSIINSKQSDRSLFVEGDYSETGNDCSRSASSLSRELAYNLEHIVHHMAIIRIAIESIRPGIELSEQFGVARSTWRNIQKNCQVQKVS